MLVPRSRLLIWVALIVLPFSLLGATISAATLLSSVLILALIMVALLDAVLAYNSLNGISVELPEVVRLTKDCEGTIELRISHENMKEKRLRLGLAFPYEIVSQNDDLIAVLPQDVKHSRLLWPCTPLKRGLYRINQCYVEGVSPMKFWALRESLAAHTEIRVYPNLLPERNNLAALFLNRGGFGIHAQRQVGKGREFEKLREYIPGDSYDEIHWKATAKRRRPITKVFQIERTQEVYVIIDASRLSARTTTQPAPRDSQLVTPSLLSSETHSQSHSGGELEVARTSHLERFITASLVMGLAAQKQGDLFGLVTFNDQIQGFVRAKSGKAHYSACRDMLYTLQPKSVNPDFDELGTFLRLRLRRRALLVFLTNLDDPILAESFVKNLELINRQHLVLVNMLQPEAARPLFSNPGVSSLDDLYHELGGHLLWHDLRELERVLHHRGVHFSLLDNEKMCVDLVSQYITIKRRQLL
jgi:uncharacterized protein (DUF58 family)